MPERYTLENHPKITTDPEVTADKLVDWTITDNDPRTVDQDVMKYAHFGATFDQARRATDRLNAGTSERSDWYWNNIKNETR